MSSKKTTPPLRGTPPKEWNNSPSPKGWQAKPDGVVPKLRFPEFRGEEGWQKTKLSRMIQLVSGMHLSPEQYGKAGTVPYFTGPSDFTNNVEAVTKRTSDSASLAEENDTLITVKGSGVGEIWFLKLPSVAMGRQLMAVRSVDAASRFVFQFLLTRKRRFEDLAAGNLIPGLSRGDILDLEAPFPLRPEQQKIAECLSSVDEVIAAQARKVDALKTYKKGLMQQLFPREGETQPRLRFPEFHNDGDWREGKLINLSSEPLSNGVFNDPKKVGSGCKLINVSDMYIETTIDESRLTLLELSPSDFEANQVITGDIFFTRSSLVKSGIAVSNIYLGSSNDVTYDGHLIRFRPSTSKVVPLFAHYLFKTAPIRAQLIARGKTATMTTIGQADVASVTLFYPDKAEQQRIASCLSSLDTTIAAETKKLEALKRHKRGLMQQLFPSVGGVAGEA